ncbi:MAG: hypothetical protein BWY22_01028 [Bacteroidetes bacterium ADurb.Bin217]|nr:MAG: hypothetical protein BWY22_01028 [Bacteroidetes bacterium ADurb.Bin217]
MHIIFTYNFLKGSNGYKSAFNGQMKDDEIYGEGNTYSAQFWEYDARLGRRWNLDPVVKPFYSSYACFSNNPIIRIDPNGDDDYSVDKKGQVTKIGTNDKADNYYDASNKNGIQKDEKGNITNTLITSTKVGALKKIDNSKDGKGQSLDFGDNSEDADKVFKSIARYKNIEYSYAKYNDNFLDENDGVLYGKNIVYTSFEKEQESYGGTKIEPRHMQLEVHKHFHPKGEYYDRFTPTPINSDNPDDKYTGDTGFARKIFDLQNQSLRRNEKLGKPKLSLPKTKFFIVTDPNIYDIEYNNGGKISK